MAGAQCGLLPEQVLSMSLPMFKAVLEGYEAHLFDLKCLTVYNGYWTGYFNNTKHPKSLGDILAKLFSEHKRSKHSKTESVVRPDVDVEGFLQRERNFKERMRRR